MKINDLKIKIAMVLTLIMIEAPIVKASASEITSNEILNMDGQQCTEFLTDKFHKTYGSENRLKKICEDSELREEINGKTGEMRTTDVKINNLIDSNNYL